MIFEYGAVYLYDHDWVRARWPGAIWLAERAQREGGKRREGNFLSVVTH
jgi:hypothetical protein